MARRANCIWHFSHYHPLELISSHLMRNPSSCLACKSSLSGNIYACKPCNYSLHSSCAKAPQFIDHPCDKWHNLQLLPTPAHRFFFCNACKLPAFGFVYQCRKCDIDLHINCASLPAQLNHYSHPHLLTLSFPPTSFQCDVCGYLGSRGLWRYRCAYCDFDAHLGCAKISPAPEPEQDVDHLECIFKKVVRVRQLKPTKSKWPPARICSTTVTKQALLGGRNAGVQHFRELSCSLGDDGGVGGSRSLESDNEDDDDDSNHDEDSGDGDDDDDDDDENYHRK